eukprot:TRINITY_DN5418_c0_g1_i2.p2 TRINITY_DN5418_c0_g1~~TRINITY_DN5418_c0_g1_i2.p2  ORF type:complete len:242 (+),score=61.13 TRINITY_DN5418_c0_g1_i2:193-918(+)
MLDVFNAHVLEMQRVLNLYAYFYLNQIFSMPEREEVYLDFEKVFEKERHMEDCTYMEFNKFFITQDKLDKFKEFFIKAKTNLREFKVNLLAGPLHRPEEPLKNPPKSFEPLFSEGIEIYKRKGDSVYDMAVNYCNPGQMAVATEKGSREITIENSLKFKNRTVDGLKIQDEEPEDRAKGISQPEYNADNYDDNLNPSFVVACLGKLSLKSPSKFDDLGPIEYSQWSQQDAVDFCIVLFSPA